jgi:hypothetical protein
VPRDHQHLELVATLPSVPTVGYYTNGALTNTELTLNSRLIAVGSTADQVKMKYKNIQTGKHIGINLNKPFF